MRRVRLPTLLALSAALFAAPDPVARAADVPPDRVALWALAQSAPLVQPAQTGAMSLVSGGDGLWLTTETTVTRYAGGLWEQPQQPPEAGGLFALAPQGEDAWAFGYEGAIWHRAAGLWRAVGSPTTADLYAATTRGPDEVWAAGFDYAAEQGTLVRLVAGTASAYTRPWLARMQLYSLATAPSGELWAGGCSYTDEPFLMRDGGHGDWQKVAVPLPIGCVFHLAFAPSGFGLAAAGQDVLAWDGAAWHATGQAPPAGLQWLRVAALDGPAGTTVEGPRNGTGWAIPAVPTWRGYVKGDLPWYFDGNAWRSGTVDYGPYAADFQPGDEADPVRPFVALTAAGGAAWTVSLGRTGGAADMLITGLVRLEAGAGRLWHPALAARPARDVAAVVGSPVWAGGEGATPLIGRSDGLWWPGAFADAVTRPEFVFVDLAGPAAGWALAQPAGAPPASYQPWRWDGVAWQALAAPTDWALRRIRALPDGGAWALAQDGRLMHWQAGSWSELPGAPPLEAPGPSDILPAARLLTPFDAAADGNRLVGCVATAAGLYRYADGSFAPVRAATGTTLPRMVDIQLADAVRGWALPYDGREADLVAGQVAQLVDCQPRMLRVDDPARPLRLGPFQIMAAAGPDTVFLYRGGGGLRMRPQLVGYQVGAGLVFENSWVADAGCPVLGMAAVPAAGPGGTDVWLAGGPWPATGPAACGPTTSGSQAIQPWPGMVSRLAVHPVASRLWLPALEP